MKRALLYITIIAGIMASCEYSPYADFTTDNDVVATGDVIYFDNFSTNTSAYDWDFGDGYYSTVRNPKHVFDVPGTYKVTLTAYGNGDSYDQAYMYITVENNTTLEVTVMEWRENPSEVFYIPNATVTLYSNEYDFYDFVNPVIEGVTGPDGRVVFTGLNTQSYFIDVYNAKYNNEQLYIDDVDFVRTTPLLSNAYNTFVAYVDYAPSFKSTARKRITKEKSDLNRTYKKPDQ